MLNFNIKKQINVLYIASILGSLSITGAWVAILAARGFSLVQIGFAETVFHITSLIFEIPSGLLADIYGRKKMLIISSIMAVVGNLVMALSGGFGMVCAALAFYALSYNFSSGSGDALAYDSLKSVSREDAYETYASNQMIIYRIGSAISTLCAGLALFMGYKPAYALSALTHFIALLVTCRLVEVRVGTEETGTGTGAGVGAEEAGVGIEDGAAAEDAGAGIEDRVGAEQVRTGMQDEIKGEMHKDTHVVSRIAKEVFRYFADSILFLRDNGRAARLMFANSLVGAVDILLLFFLQAKLTAAGISNAGLGIALFSMELGGILGARLIVRAKKSRYLHIFVVCAVGVTAGVLLEHTGMVVAMTLGGFLSAMADDALQVRTDARLQDIFPSEQRATLISISSFTFSVVMIVLSPLAGYFFDVW